MNVAAHATDNHRRAAGMVTARARAVSSPQASAPTAMASFGVENGVSRPGHTASGSTATLANATRCAAPTSASPHRRRHVVHATALPLPAASPARGLTASASHANGR